MTHTSRRWPGSCNIHSDLHDFLGNDRRIATANLQGNNKWLHRCAKLIVLKKLAHLVAAACASHCHDLERVMLDIYNPKTGQLLFQWNIEISYSWTGGDGSFWTDTEALKYAIRKAGLAPSEAKYELRLKTKLGRRDVAGWGKVAARSTEGMVRQSVGTTVEHSGLSGSASYLRRA